MSAALSVFRFVLLFIKPGKKDIFLTAENMMNVAIPLQESKEVWCIANNTKKKDNKYKYCGKYRAPDTKF